MPKICKFPLKLTAQPEGGYTVTCPSVPELLTEGDTVEEAVQNVQDALKAVVELYEDTNRSLPAELLLDEVQSDIEFEYLTAAP